MPTLARPDVDVLDGITTAISVDQERMGSNPRSTVGTVTDADAMLRILFSRLGAADLGSPGAYSFNVASVRQRRHHRRARRQAITESASFSRVGGMCQRCEGRGSVDDFDLAALVRRRPSRSTTARSRSPATAWTAGPAGSSAAAGFFDPDKPINQFNKRELHDLLYKDATKIKVEGHQPHLPRPDPADPEVDARQGRRGDAAAHPRVRGAGGRVHHLPGVRGHPAQPRGARVEDRRRRHRRRLARWRSARSPSGSRTIDEPSVAPLLDGAARDDRVVRGHRARLPVARPAVGHAVGRRVPAHEDDPPPRLVARPTSRTSSTSRRSACTRTTSQRMNDLLRQLRDKGNTVLVVEHKPETIAIADHVVDLGPRAGAHGGEIMLRGHRRGAARRATPSPAVTSTTARALKDAVRTPTAARVRGASTNNLQDSTSTSRSACSSCSPAWPARARARSSAARCRATRAS